MNLINLKKTAFKNCEDLGKLQEVKTNFLQALSIWSEFGDQYMIETFSIPALKRFYQTTQDPSILEAIALIFRPCRLFMIQFMQLLMLNATGRLTILFLG